MDLSAENGLAGGTLPGDTEAAAGAALNLLVDELAHGVLVLTLEGRLLHANQAARHELARCRVFSVRDHMLQACNPEGAKALQDAFARVAQGKRGLVEFPGADGPGLTAAAVPLKGKGAEFPLRVALLFARVAVCDSLMLCYFARSHGLTPAEEQVLGILCQGYSAPEAAKQLEVAVSTVRSHVRSLCAKARCGSVRELVSRIAMLPPVAPPFWHQPMH